MGWFLGASSRPLRSKTFFSSVMVAEYFRSSNWLPTVRKSKILALDPFWRAAQ